jgi:hypothetical protein
MKMISSMQYKINLFLFLLLLLTACAPSASAIQAAIAGTQAAWTPVPTQTPYPTYTLYPTYTPYPTFTPSPTLTPTPVVTGDMIVAAFKAAGLEAEGAYPMTKDDYGMAPYVCQGTHFLIPSLGPDNGGRIYVCDNPGEQSALAGYYQAFGKGSAIFFSWVFEKGNIVVQINGDLPETTARLYEAAIP